jgi:thioredoxin 1
MLESRKDSTDARRIEAMPALNDTKTLNILGGAVLVAIVIGYLSFSQGKLPDAREMPDSSFKRTILESGVPVLVDFSADWCGACRAMSPILDNFENRNSNVKVVRVNVDKNRDLAQYFQISSIPTLMVFKDGKLTARQSGVTDENTLQKLIGR